MKHTITFIVFLTIGCNNLGTEVSKSPVQDSIAIESNISKYYTSRDTVTIVSDTDIIYKFNKKEFNRIVDEHPEFYQGFTYNPDYLYHQYGNRVNFGSEQGQDAYYVLYAYFLKLKNGEDGLAEQRNQLIKIYRNINQLFSRFQYGGPFFGHQHIRIVGYAEYSLYIYPKNEEKFEKTYDITKQKELYIKSLRQLILDESSIDTETVGAPKVERTTMLNKIVDDLDGLITNIFYLRRAQVFQYENYEYH